MMDLVKELNNMSYEEAQKELSNRGFKYDSDYFGDNYAMRDEYWCDDDGTMITFTSTVLWYDDYDDFL